MDSVQELTGEQALAGDLGDCVQVQAVVSLVVLSSDWIIRRASENIHHLLGRRAEDLVGLSLSDVVEQEMLHDLRNRVSRSVGSGAVARVFSVQVLELAPRVDVAIQLVEGRWLIEMISSPERFGQHFTSVAALFGGLSSAKGQALLEGAARRMRALTGFDCVSLRTGQRTARNDNGLAPPGEVTIGHDCPAIIADLTAQPVALAPCSAMPGAAASALLRCPGNEEIARLERAGIRSLLRIPFDGGEFVCSSKSPRKPDFELHAAAELFAQMVAMQIRMADPDA